MPKISVIIPVYNTKPYLEQCLKSVTEQTFTDLEILCVDSSSTDGSSLELARLAQQDTRIKVFTVSHLGPGNGRNKGLEEARGKYILFLDSDDFLAPTACAELYEVSERENLDVATADFYEYHEQTGKVTPHSKALELACKYSLDVATGDGPDEFAKLAFASPFVWLKLMRRSVIENAHLRFPTGAAEDVPFCVLLLVCCKKARVLEGHFLQYYRIGRTGNISSNGSKMVLDGVKNFGILAEKLRKYGVFEQVKETYWFNFMVLLIGDERLFVGRLGNVSSDTVKQAYDLIRSQIESLDLKLFANRNAMFRWKVRHFKQAVLQNDLKFPRRLRKIRNILMIVLNPWYKIKSRLNSKK